MLGWRPAGRCTWILVNLYNLCFTTLKESDLGLSSVEWMSSLFVQESLRKITHTLALKNEEISNFISTLKQSLDNLEVIGDTEIQHPPGLSVSVWM